MYAESMESAPEAPLTALRATGAPRAQVIRYASCRRPHRCWPTAPCYSSKATSAVSIIVLVTIIDRGSALIRKKLS